MEGNQRVSQRNTHIPQHGRVGQVALQARNRQLRRQVVQYGIGYSEIPLRIFIIDGVHLVRHCRRTHFSRFDLLRREGYPHPYETLKALTRTNTVINADSIREFIDTLDVSESVKEELRKITPHSYTGF